MSNQGFIWNVGQSRKIKLSTIKDYIVRGYGKEDNGEWEVVAVMSVNDTSIVFKTTSKTAAIEWVDDMTKVDK